MCAAALLGLSLTSPESSGAQSSGQQSAPETQQTRKPPSGQKAQAAPPRPQPGKQVSAQKAQAREPSAAQTQQTGKPSLQKPQAAPPNQQTGKPPSSQKPEAAPPSQQLAKQAAGQSAQAAQPSPQTGKQASRLKAQGAQAPAIPAGYRLLTLKEGRAIAQGMAWADDEEGLSPDCSHLVHKLYEQAGHPYPYASSLDLYLGTGPFLRVRYAHPGDLVVWRGHVGIVVNPREHSFFSTTSSGARTQSYRSAYWRGRGYPHFFRYLTKRPLKDAPSEASNRPPAS
jgi:NlpC/P60 family